MTNRRPKRTDSHRLRPTVAADGFSLWHESGTKRRNDGQNRPSETKQAPSKGCLTCGYTWSGRRDSNPRPSPWQGDALPLSHFRVTTTNPSKRPRHPVAVCLKDPEVHRSSDGQMPNRSLSAGPLHPSKSRHATSHQRFRPPHDPCWRNRRGGGRKPLS